MEQGQQFIITLVVTLECRPPPGPPWPGENTLYTVVTLLNESQAAPGRGRGMLSPVSHSRHQTL